MGRPGQLTHRKSKQQVVHGRVAHDNHLVDLFGLFDTGVPAEFFKKAVQGVHDYFLKGIGAFKGSMGINHPGDHILAVGNLRIHDPFGRQGAPGFKIDQISGNLGGTQINRHPQVSTV